MKVLLLGGTSEAREIASNPPAGVDLVVSWAGRTGEAPAGISRVGGFGGVSGLCGYLATEQIAAVIDATHPFAHRMTEQAAQATRLTGLPLLRVSRPSWAGHPCASSWIWVDDHAAAARIASPRGRTLLTVGGQSLTPYLGLAEVIARAAVAPPVALPPGWRLLLARGPFAEEDERRLLASEHIGVLVTKDSGGHSGKLDAAAALNVTVVIVRRAQTPPGLLIVSDAAGALHWLAGLTARQG